MRHRCVSADLFWERLLRQKWGLGWLEQGQCLLLLSLLFLVEGSGYFHFENKEDVDVWEADNIIYLACIQELGKIHVDLLQDAKRRVRIRLNQDLDDYLPSDKLPVGIPFQTYLAKERLWSYGYIWIYWQLRRLWIGKWTRFLGMAWISLTRNDPVLISLLILVWPISKLNDSFLRLNRALEAQVLWWETVLALD